MKEDNWYKMLVASALLHVLIIGGFSVSFPKTRKKLDIPHYSVNLVGDIAGSVSRASAPAAASRAAEPRKEVPTPKSRKEKPAVQPEKARSIAPKTAAQKDTTRTTKDEVKSLDERIRELKRRTQYMDVTGRKDGTTTAKGSGAGIPTSSGGGGGSMNPQLQRYYLQVWEKIQAAWHPPGMTLKKNLETKVSIKVRKDGRIVDIEIDERSGNRIYDETVLRALRSIDILPPIPPSIAEDMIEIGFSFHPPAEPR